jgi:stalled ribosome rescue protein Dom34
METEKKIGIWMDHSNAHLIHLDKEDTDSSVQSDFTHILKEEALSRSEKIMHNKEQQMQEAFYEKIADEILNYDHVLLFGPTHAKNELHNYLDKDLHFKDIKITVLPEEKMTDREKHAIVVDYFNQY